MKKAFSLLFMLIFCTSAQWAQQTELLKYETIPVDFQHVYLDFVGDHACRLNTSDHGQYIGQTDYKGVIYGYGMFCNNDGSQIVGQFRNGQLLFGITMNGESAMVGSKNFYACYSLTTGRLQYVFKEKENKLYDMKTQYDYAFVSITYNNGDRYIGEIVRGKRHGYGIYYYANGDYWYGQYNNDIRNGFGAHFTTTNNLQIGQWKGEETPRLIAVKKK